MKRTARLSVFSVSRLQVYFLSCVILAVASTFSKEVYLNRNRVIYAKERLGSIKGTEKSVVSTCKDNKVFDRNRLANESIEDVGRSRDLDEFLKDVGNVLKWTDRVTLCVNDTTRGDDSHVNQHFTVPVRTRDVRERSDIGYGSRLRGGKGFDRNYEAMRMLRRKKYGRKGTRDAFRRVYLDRDVTFKRDVNNADLNALYQPHDTPDRAVYNGETMTNQSLKESAAKKNLYSLNNWSNPNGNLKVTNDDSIRPPDYELVREIPIRIIKSKGLTNLKEINQRNTIAILKNIFQNINAEKNHSNSFDFAQNIFATFSFVDSTHFSRTDGANGAGKCLKNRSDDERLTNATQRVSRLVGGQSGEPPWGNTSRDFGIAANESRSRETIAGGKEIAASGNREPIPGVIRAFEPRGRPHQKQEAETTARLSGRKDGALVARMRTNADKPDKPRSAKEDAPPIDSVSDATRKPEAAYTNAAGTGASIIPRDLTSTAVDNDPRKQQQMVPPPSAESSRANKSNGNSDSGGINIRAGGSNGNETMNVKEGTRTVMETREYHESDDNLRRKLLWISIGDGAEGSPTKSTAIDTGIETIESVANVNRQRNKIGSSNLKRQLIRAKREFRDAEDRALRGTLNLQTSRNKRSVYPYENLETNYEVGCDNTAVDKEAAVNYDEKQKNNDYLNENVNELKASDREQDNDVESRKKKQEIDPTRAKVDTLIKQKLEEKHKSDNFYRKKRQSTSNLVEYYDYDDVEERDEPENDREIQNNDDEYPFNTKISKRDNKPLCKPGDILGRKKNENAEAVRREELRKAQTKNKEPKEQIVIDLRKPKNETNDRDDKEASASPRSNFEDSFDEERQLSDEVNLYDDLEDDRPEDRYYYRENSDNVEALYGKLKNVYDRTDGELKSGSRLRGDQRLYKSDDTLDTNPPQLQPLSDGFLAGSDSAQRGFQSINASRTNSGSLCQNEDHVAFKTHERDLNVEKRETINSQDFHESFVEPLDGHDESDNDVKIRLGRGLKAVKEKLINSSPDNKLDNVIDVNFNPAEFTLQTFHGNSSNNDTNQFLIYVINTNQDLEAAEQKYVNNEVSRINRALVHRTFYDNLNRNKRNSEETDESLGNRLLSPGILGDQYSDVRDTYQPTKVPRTGTRKKECPARKSEKNRRFPERSRSHFASRARRRHAHRAVTGNLSRRDLKRKGKTETSPSIKRAGIRKSKAAEQGLFLKSDGKVVYESSEGQSVSERTIADRAARAKEREELRLIFQTVKPTEDDARRKEITLLLAAGDDEPQMDVAFPGELAGKIAEQIFQRVQKNNKLKNALGLYRDPTTKDAITGNVYRQGLENGTNRTEAIVRKVVGLLGTLILNDAQRRTCASLSRDMREFLKRMLGMDREEELPEETPPLPLVHEGIVPEQDAGRKFLFDIAGHEEEQDINDLQRKARVLESLLREYDALTEREKTKLRTVHDYLIRQLDLLLRYIEARQAAETKGKPALALIGAARGASILQYQSAMLNATNASHSATKDAFSLPIDTHNPFRSDNVSLGARNKRLRDSRAASRRRETRSLGKILRRQHRAKHLKRFRDREENKGYGKSQRDRKYRKSRRKRANSKESDQLSLKYLDYGKPRIHDSLEPLETRLRDEKRRPKLVKKDMAIESNGMINFLPIKEKNRAEDEATLLNKRKSWRRKNEEQLEEVAFGKDMRNNTKSEKARFETLKVKDTPNRITSKTKRGNVARGTSTEDYSNKSHGGSDSKINNADGTVRNEGSLGPVAARGINIVADNKTNTAIDFEEKLTTNTKIDRARLCKLDGRRRGPEGAEVSTAEKRADDNAVKLNRPTNYRPEEMDPEIRLSRNKLGEKYVAELGELGDPDPKTNSALDSVSRIHLMEKETAISSGNKNIEPQFLVRNYRLGRITMISRTLSAFHFPGIRSSNVYQYPEEIYLGYDPFKKHRTCEAKYIPFEESGREKKTLFRGMIWQAKA
ncbi:hypothetical protein PUN28_007299 [Cardiocondyla obscurior]|uniref:Uncharacterized protein n=1 Tax=Cardiocondyla obscurior TaxID=286306 RepID=A0AAW2G8D8_9HYME